MYIFKNAIRNVWRSKGRSILIGIIVCLLMFSTCVGLSIQQASKKSQDASLSLTNIQGQIQINRMNLMKGANSKEEAKKSFNNLSNLSLEQLQNYADSKYVSNFYYSASLNLQPSDSFTLLENQQEGPGPSHQENASSIQLVGYEDDEAMTDFTNGTSSISEGKMFDEGTKENQCILPEELAVYNSVSVGDTITLKADDTTSLNFIVTGLYSTTANQNNGPSMNSNNSIYTSYNVVKQISDDNSMDLNVNGTYTFKNVQDFNDFKEECTQKGLSDDYTITSNDLNQYEQSVAPLKNLSTFANYFVIILGVVGILVLVVLNILNIRQRKQEIGILCALGMHKTKIILQFICETLFITFFAFLIGAGLGAFLSVPITNTLLDSQITSQNKLVEQKDFNFNRGETSNEGNKKNMPALTKATTISDATNITVIFEVAFFACILIILSNGAGLIYILRYNPSEILSKQD